MNGFLKALKEDLLDRRMRLPAAVAVVILIAGIAYAATSSSSTPAEGGVLPSGRTAALPAKPPSALEGASLSEKETTYSSGREPSSPRDPFRYPTATSGTVNASGTVGGRRPRREPNPKPRAARSPVPADDHLDDHHHDQLLLWQQPRQRRSLPAGWPPGRAAEGRREGR
jgi:hypothetical protein